MPRRWIQACAVALLCLAGSRTPAAAETEPLLLGDDERILVLAPHPDDETLAAGGLIQEALGLDLPVRVCFFTMGDNNEISFLFTRKHPVLMPGAVRSMGALRQNEAVAAATQLGLSTNDLVFLGYPDYGTLDVWNHHWRDAPPFRSMLTRVSAVPYDRALTPGAAYAGEDILDDLVEVLRDFRPTHVVLSHPADHNVDHRALYLFARVALWSLEAEGVSPDLLAYPVHFTQWPEPRRYHPLRPAAPPHFLDDAIPWQEFVLAPFQVTNKLAALRRHHSQFLYASAYLQSFVRRSEVFGDFPDLLLPGGAGAAEIPETDATQFRTDAALFQELAAESDPWNDVASQAAAEARYLDDHDNDFLGRAVSGDGRHLTLSFRFRKPVSQATTLAVSLFGFRPDVPFGQMPKIVVGLTPAKPVAVHDLGAKLSPDSVEVVRGDGEEIVLRVPFALLGYPEKILAGAKISKGKLPIDWVAWRAIDLFGAPLPAPPTSPPPGTPSVRLAPPGKPSAPPAPPPAGEQAEPPPKMEIVPLAPRVSLPRKSIPEKTEANEPVLW